MRGARLLVSGGRDGLLGGLETGEACGGRCGCGGHGGVVLGNPHGGRSS